MGQKDWRTWVPLASQSQGQPVGSPRATARPSPGAALTATEPAWQGSPRSPAKGVRTPNPASEPMPQTSPASPRAVASGAETALPSGQPGLRMPVPPLPTREPDTPSRGGAGHSRQRQGQHWRQRHRRQLGRPCPHPLRGSWSRCPGPEAHCLPGTHVLLQDLPPPPGLSESPSEREAQGPTEQDPLVSAGRRRSGPSQPAGAGAATGPAPTPSAHQEARHPQLRTDPAPSRESLGQQRHPEPRGDGPREAWEDRSSHSTQPTGAWCLERLRGVAARLRRQACGTVTESGVRRASGLRARPRFWAGDHVSHRGDQSSEARLLCRST